MRILGSLYMLWLAVKIAFAGPIGEVEGGGSPLGFLPAVAFRWVNPKAWVAILGALAAYAPIDHHVRAKRGADGRPVHSDHHPERRRLGAVRHPAQAPPRSAVRPFNPAMAVILAASTAPMLFE